MLLLNLMSSIDYLEQEMGLVKNTIQSFESDLVEFKEKLSKMEEVTQNIRLVVAKLEGAALATHIKIDTNIDTIEGNASIEQKIK
jgi:site-specific recombinase XerD